MMPIKNEYLKTFVNLRARNIRYLFIIDSGIAISEILDLCYKNQEFWGGRYNPIIPSYNGKIPDNYLKLASCFDPDYIIYSKGTNINQIKNLFNPIEYIEIVGIFQIELKGVDSSYLLHNDGKENILYENYLYKSLPNLYSFYKLNFGFLDGIENSKTRKFTPINIDSENQKNLNEIIIYKPHFMISRLSKMNVNRPIIKTNFDLSGRIELIVSDENNQFEDLLYYWNRQLYFKHGSYFHNQMYITNKQLTEFLNDNDDVDFFAALTGSRDIKISSLSLNKNELDEIKQKLNNWQKAIEFHLKGKIVFPFKSEEDIVLNDEFEEPYIKQSLVGENDLLQIPQLSFENYHNLSYGEWIIDLSVEKDNELYNELSLPISSKLTKLFCHETARVNKDNKISIEIDNEDRFINFKVPSDEKIFRELLINRSKENGIIEIKTSDDGMRVSSLISIFNYNFSLIEYFFVSKYWLNIFRGKSALANKNDKRIEASKGILNFKDLVLEYRNRKTILTESFHPIDENSLKRDLELLVEKGIYFIGYKIKCKNCGSKLWYSLSELGELIKCKGCLQNITLSIESIIDYKLNDVVRNCLISNSGSKNDLHGNLTVLLFLVEMNSLSHTSFYYMPQQNYYVNGLENHRSDIDILCIKDGKLIIGEAKNSVSEFKNKEIENLIYLGNNINPNEIVLVFNEGEEENLNNTIDKIKNGLINKYINVKAHGVLTEFYISGGNRRIRRR